VLINPIIQTRTHLISGVYPLYTSQYVITLQSRNLSSLQSRNIKIRIKRTIISSLVWYGCETRPLTLREEQRLRVFENMVLRRLFMSKSDEETGGWRRLHNEELHKL
jgi:hypothetical protein